LESSYLFFRSHFLSIGLKAVNGSE
jgi:hypothetical protein